MKIDYVKLVEAELSCIIRMGGSSLPPEAPLTLLAIL